MQLAFMASLTGLPLEGLRYKGVLRSSGDRLLEETGQVR